MRLAMVVAVTLALFGCGGTDAVVDETEAAQKGGCHTICPKCHPHELCPAIACYQDCEHNCVQTQLCMIGYAFDPLSCSCVPAP
jgi:hypothetical protein